MSRKTPEHPKILIGAPVFKREWILPLWFKFIEEQNYPLSNLGFVFQLGDEDEGTHSLLWDWYESHPEVSIFMGDIDLTISHREHAEGQRHWTQMRYLNMAHMRNNLLDRATALQHTFQYYFSLDSDILLEDPETLNKLVTLSRENKNAVISPLCYMKPYPEDETAINYPNIMSWYDTPGGMAVRTVDKYPIGEDFKSDIVMAAVFMPKNIYMNVRYRAHRQGEDLGFAYNLHKAGFKSIAATSIYCPHIMHKFMLEKLNYVDL